MRISIPPDMLLGCATSSHQVEGQNANNDWWDFEHQPASIHDASTSGDACGWWSGRAEEDLTLAASRGQNAHRMSVEWSRLEPEPGRFDDSAFDRYARILACAKDLGMTVMVTLHHFTLPRWIKERGSFEWDGIAPAFERFGLECARRLDASLYATLNEPNVLAFMAYITSQWPPARGSIRAGARAIRNMLRAHAAAYRAMRSQTKAPIGIVLNVPMFIPMNKNGLLDRMVTRVQGFSFLGVFLQALATGRLWPPAGHGETLPGVARSFDFLGANYYGRYRIRFDHTAAARGFGQTDASETIHTAHNDWGENHPEGLTDQLLRLSRLDVPLYVTENGVFDPDDRLRPGFLREHLAAAVRARELGADVRGYFHWSLVDNFEWAEGWSAPFGLFALDRTTQVRTARPSADVYEEICRTRTVTSR